MVSSIVTDKKYHLDPNLVQNLQYMIKRQSKKFDNLIIIDGDEGYGKSTFAQAIAYYLAHETGSTFTHENIFFDIDELMKYAAETRKKVLVWDEGALGGLGKQWQNKTQQQLLQFLMTGRKYGHFLIIIIPKITELQKYIATYRSICLIHVYSPDHMSRGYFVFMNKKQKNRTYHLMKSSNRTFYDKYSFHGRFVNTDFLIDQEAYEDKKDKAIRSIFEQNNEATGGKYLTQARKFKYLWAKRCKETNWSKEGMKEAGIKESTFYDYANYDKIYPNILEKH